MVVFNSLLMAYTVDRKPSIAATLGEWHFRCYTEVNVVEGVLYRIKLNRDQGYWSLCVVERWLLREVPL